MKRHRMRPPTTRSLCVFDGCGRPVQGHGLCEGHYGQRRRGSQLRPLPDKWMPRKVVTHPTIPRAALVPLTRGRFAIIDLDDAAAVDRHSWQCIKGRHAFYATTSRRTNGRSSHLPLHLFLWDRWGMPPCDELDHKNANGLDCRRENLRPATASQNRANAVLRVDNRSGFKGVGFHKHSGKWRARVAFNRVVTYLGLFDSAEEAARAYGEAAVRIQGEFARIGGSMPQPIPRIEAGTLTDATT